MAQFVADEAQAQGLPQPRALLLHDPTPVTVEYPGAVQQ
jgi:hypothetical protein